MKGMVIKLFFKIVLLVVLLLLLMSVDSKDIQYIYANF